MTAYRQFLIGFCLGLLLINSAFAQSQPDTENNGRGKLLYYRNPMGLPDISNEPKKDSMGMDYIPVYENEVNSDDNSVQVSLSKVQKLGVRTEAAKTRIIKRTIRAVGTVQPDESRQMIVTTRYDGWIEELNVNKTGQQVKEGQPLMTIYSPQIALAEQELVLANRSGGGISQAARRKLSLLGISESEIESVRKSGKPNRTIVLPAPMSGQVLEKMVIDGMHIQAGEPLYKIVDLSEVWVLADVYEQDVGLIKPGQEVDLSFTAFPGEKVKGQVDFIYPNLTMQTRTAKVRVLLPNPDNRFRTDMYVSAEFQAPASGEPIVSVPSSAILDTGKHQIVLVEKGEGKYEPREVKVGQRTAEYTEIDEGLQEGESVVVSANFLIDAESNLQSALKAFTKDESQPSPEKEKKP